MKSTYKIFLILLLCSSNAYADGKPWYTYWSLGYAKHTYSGDLKTAVDTAIADSNTQLSNSSLDIFGFYIPFVNEQTLLGIVSHVSADSLSNTNSLNIQQYITSMSLMHFFGGEVGEGLFFRGDYGSTQVNITPSNGFSTSGRSGKGYLISTGVGFTLPNGNHLILSFGHTENIVGSESYKAKNFTVGMLW